MNAVIAGGGLECIARLGGDGSAIRVQQAAEIEHVTTCQDAGNFTLERGRLLDDQGAGAGGKRNYRTGGDQTVELQRRTGVDRERTVAGDVAGKIQIPAM